MLGQGPGKYDDLSEYCIKKANASAVVLLVFNGNKGSGISQSSIPDMEFEIATTHAAIAKGLPGMLRFIAQSIETAPESMFNQDNGKS